MSFHEHGAGDGLLILWESKLYCNDGLSKCQNFIDAHVYIREFQQAFQFLIYFQSHKTDAYVCI